MRGTTMPIRELDSSTYQCSRCGIIRNCTASRPKPEHCSDCDSVLRYKPPVPRAERAPLIRLPHLTDEECLAARNAYRHGERSPEVAAGAREYWRRKDDAKRRRKAAS